MNHYPTFATIGSAPGGAPAAAPYATPVVPLSEPSRSVAGPQRSPYAAAASRLAGSSAAMTPGAAGGETERAPARPLRVIHIGTHLLPAGIEHWLAALIQFADPRRLQFLRCVVTSGHVDSRMASRLGVPIEVGGRDSVRRAAADADVLLLSSPAEAAEWLADARPPLCVIVAHGDGPWTRSILDSCAPIVDHVVAVSGRVEQAVCGGFPTTVILNGIDASHIASTRPRAVVRSTLGFHPHDFVLGYVGRFSHEKDPGAVLEAVALLPPQFKALLVGFGYQRMELLERANEIVPGRYAFVSADQGLGDYYQAMDAFCLTSTMEGFGLVILEALLSRRPVIARAIGFVPELIVDRVNGLVVDGSPASVADAARRLHDFPGWAAGVAAEGFQLAERFGYATRMAREYEDLLERLFQERFPDAMQVEAQTEYARAAPARAATDPAAVYGWAGPRFGDQV